MYGDELAFAIVRLLAGSIVDGITFGYSSDKVSRDQQHDSAGGEEEGDAFAAAHIRHRCADRGGDDRDREYRRPRVAVRGDGPTQERRRRELTVHDGESGPQFGSVVPNSAAGLQREKIAPWVTNIERTTSPPSTAYGEKRSRIPPA